MRTRVCVCVYVYVFCVCVSCLEPVPRCKEGNQALSMPPAPPTTHHAHSKPSQL